MPVVVLKGPVAYKYKGVTHQRDIPSHDLSAADAAHLVRTGKFVYIGGKLPEQKAEIENRARRTRKMSDVLGTNKQTGSDLTTQDLQPKEPEAKKADDTKKTSSVKKEDKKTKVQKTTAVDGGVPVFETTQELSDWAFNEHGIMVSDGTYEEVVQQIQEGIAANKEEGVTV